MTLIRSESATYAPRPHCLAKAPTQAEKGAVGAPQTEDSTGVNGELRQLRDQLCSVTEEITSLSQDPSFDKDFVDLHDASAAAWRALLALDRVLRWG